MGLLTIKDVVSFFVSMGSGTEVPRFVVAIISLYFSNAKYKEHHGIYLIQTTISELFNESFIYVRC